ncbi:hypothetical protein EBQ24_08805 [Allofranklinella schreckenbergeri]|uniref:DUF2190 domain-containing protein n=1 Tax=Allofranklinella schreckenbergeri TaxID=1076744 RepID=A0A3M6QWM5_9BURK|nr:hypothetical protein [Allofranklinella schreckenbergeri]RMX07426.1 hypothetical protein EBQ24_08805 [Allofranklinella schreckenbergeri]
MAALDKDRATPERKGDLVADPLDAGATIYAGGMYVLKAGKAKPAAASDSGAVRAVARKRASAAAGDAHVDGLISVFRFDNAASGSAITRADIGANAYVVDDQTVGKTGTCIAGVVLDVEDAGVWVRIGAKA